MQQAGIEVEVGIDEQICKEHNRAYLMSRQHHRPWIRLKAGISLDGKIATHFGESQWITSPSSRRHAHLILECGRWYFGWENTLIQDNPSLTTRLLEEDLSKHHNKKIQPAQTYRFDDRRY